MRAMIEGLDTPHPLGPLLPAMFQEDEFAQRFISAFDTVLAPVFSTLDNIDSYFDPMLAPEDFVDWLASWVGLAIDETWPVERRRLLVARAVELYQWRGTRRGLAAHIAVYTGTEPEIEDHGGVAWSPSPMADLLGTDTPQVTVRLRVPDPKAIDQARLDRVVTAAKPAHLGHTIEVVKG